MGRLRQPLVPDGPIRLFCERLHALHAAAGEPSTRQLQQAGWHASGADGVQRRRAGMRPRAVSGAANRVDKVIVLLVLVVLAMHGCGVKGGSTVAESGPPSEISVKVDAVTYQAGATIAVTVVNGGSQPIYTEDQKADCTIAILQRRTGSQWTDLSPCGSERAARTVSLQAGGVHQASINTASVNFADQPVVRGQYRVVFSFRRAQQPEAGEDGRVQSATFTIG